MCKVILMPDLQTRSEHKVGKIPQQATNVALPNPRNKETSKMWAQTTRSILRPVVERENKTGTNTNTITMIISFLKLSRPLWLYQGKTLNFFNFVVARTQHKLKLCHYGYIRTKYSICLFVVRTQHKLEIST